MDKTLVARHLVLTVAQINLHSIAAQQSPAAAANAASSQSFNDISSRSRSNAPVGNDRQTLVLTLSEVQDGCSDGAYRTAEDV